MSFDDAVKMIDRFNRETTIRSTRATDALRHRAVEFIGPGEAAQPSDGARRRAAGVSAREGDNQGWGLRLSGEARPSSQ